MENFFARSWWILALRGAFGILFGALALVWPQLTLLTLVALFAAYALLNGITAIAGSIRNRNKNDDWWVMRSCSALVLVLVIGATYRGCNPVAQGNRG